MSTGELQNYFNTIQTLPREPSARRVSKHQTHSKIENAICYNLAIHKNAFNLESAEMIRIFSLVVKGNFRGVVK